MRGVANSLAALLSILIVSTSMSASACDLSCGLRQTHSDCHAASSATTDKDDVAMPSGMDMGSDQNESATGPGMSAVPPAHSMLMVPEMTTEQFDTKPETGRSAMPGHSKTGSSCARETCSQISVSASPPSGDHPQPNSPHRIAISISTPVNLRIAFYSTRVGSPPALILASDRLVTTLRI